MCDFSTLEQVEALFKEAGCVGAENHYFVAVKDTSSSPATMMGGMVGGMISASMYPYDGWLVNMTENGLCVFYLNQNGFTLAAPRADKMTLNKGSYNFIPFSAVKRIKVSNYALLNNKVKKILIDTAEGHNHYLYTNVVDKNFAFHADGFAKFMEKYSK